MFVNLVVPKIVSYRCSGNVVFTIGLNSMTWHLHCGGTTFIRLTPEGHLILSLNSDWWQR